MSQWNQLYTSSIPVPYHVSGVIQLPNSLVSARSRHRNPPYSPHSEQSFPRLGTHSQDWPMQSHQLVTGLYIVNLTLPLPFSVDTGWPLKQNSPQNPFDHGMATFSRQCGDHIPCVCYLWLEASWYIKTYRICSKLVEHFLQLNVYYPYTHFTPTSAFYHL